LKTKKPGRKEEEGGLRKKERTGGGTLLLGDAPFFVGEKKEL